MRLILHVIGMIIFISGHNLYAQDVGRPESVTTDDSSTMAYTTPDTTSDQKQQDFGGQNQAHATPPQVADTVTNEQTPLPVDAEGQQVSPDQQKMHEEWLMQQGAAQAAQASQQQMAQPQAAPEQTQPNREPTRNQASTVVPAPQEKAASTPSSASSTAVPQMPVHESKPKKPSIPVIEEIKGINTVDLEESRGNWLFKRIWWERAEKKYEKIRLLVEKIIDSRMEFFEKRTQTDREVLDPFYHAMGMDQGELKTIVGQLIAQLQQERDKEGVLNAQERDLLQVLTTEKKSIEQLQGYVETIAKLDIELDEALNKLLEQINAIRRYERDAWQQFKDIARVLSDTKARELYANMEVVLANIQEVQEYLQEPFKEHFDHIINMITTHVDFIKNTAQALKEKGIDLQARMKAKTEKIKPAQQEDQDEEQEEPEESEQGFIGRTMGAITAGFKTMWNYAVFVVTWPYVKLFGAAESEPEDDESEESEQEAPERSEQPEAAA